ncbi:MAG TPA: hypothetical protein VFQ53_27990 [Kofleriaceae bacterium]|nr:hypothetical protein [Kofleriaceae bacterium]
MKQALALAALVVAVSLPSSADAGDKKPYTLADLKTLVAQKSYKEAVDHLSDVAPSERTAEWNDIAAQAAAGYVGGLSNDDLVVKVVAIEQVDSDYPQILKNAKYTKVRADIGLKAYAACFEKSWWLDECLQHAVKFVEADASNGDLALKMAKLVRKSANAYVAVPHFKRALAAGKANAAAICKDEDLKLAIVAGLGLPSDYDNAKDSRAIASGPCWDALKKPIVDQFKAEEGGYFKDNTCDMLKAKKVMTAEMSKQCK